MSRGNAPPVVAPVLLGGLMFGLGLGMFFWWAARDPAFAAYAGLFSGVLFSWRMKRLFGVPRG